jgi:hypothetical protein
MVNTRSSHPLRPLPSAPGMSNDPELRDFLKIMVESMEVLRKQNEELNTRLTATEARSSQKERERAERCENERRDRVHRGKRPANPQEDNESTVQGENEENRSKSRRVENDNDGSRRERQEGERSHRSKQHRDKSRREESRHSLHDAKMKDLEDKYSRILCQMEGEHPELTAWDMLEDESLPFTE